MDDAPGNGTAEDRPDIFDVPLGWWVEARPHPRFERPLEVSVRQAPLLTSAPWVRSVGKLALDVNTQGWRFPLPPDHKPPIPPVTQEQATPPAPSPPSEEALPL